MAAISKINDIYRMVIYVKNEDFEALTGIKDCLEQVLNEWESRGITKQIQVQFDFDPMNFV
jgi:primosomal protein N' (replication factor Y)